MSIPAKKLTLEVRKVLFGEQSTELGVPKRVSLVRAQLEHGDSVGRGERVSLDLVLQAREGSWVLVWVIHFHQARLTVESIISKRRGDLASDRASRSDVGVGASLVWCSGVVGPGRLDDNLEVVIVEEIRDAEEASSKVLRRLDLTELAHTFGQYLRRRGEMGCCTRGKQCNSPYGPGSEFGRPEALPAR